MMLEFWLKKPVGNDCIDGVHGGFVDAFEPDIDARR
jgi:hypothetical protein